MAPPIYFYARDGMLLTLCVTLNSMNPAAVKAILEQEVMDHEGGSMTPLMAAAHMGHLKVVKLLINRYGADVDKCGSVFTENILVKGASSLWVAAAAGHLPIVKALVEAGAIIDQQTVTGSTPIRVACYEGHLDIVIYLHNCGAELETTNAVMNTCLMIASYRGHLDVVKYLLGLKVDTSQRASCGSTALHFAADKGHTDIIQCLIEGGADFSDDNKDKQGFSPLIIAALHANHAAVELFISQKDATFKKQQIIDAYELLGASFANDQDKYNLGLCVKYLRHAMVLRFEENSEQPVPKPPAAAPVMAYENRIECQSLSELEAIVDNRNALHMESLIIRERLLGPIFTEELTNPLVYRGVMLQEERQFERCLQLWQHRLDLLLADDVCVGLDILRFASVFSYQLAYQWTLNIDQLTSVLKTVYCYLTTKPRTSSLDYYLDETEDKKDYDVMINSMFQLIVVYYLVYIGTQDTSTEVFKKILFDIIKLNPCTSVGKGFIHLAVDPMTRVNSFLTAIGIRFPFCPLLSLLVECGADVNQTDSNKNTPLHLIATSTTTYRDFERVHGSFGDLKRYGAHLDAVNAEGKTPLECASSELVKSIIKDLLNVQPLKCLAARAVFLNNIDYKEYIHSHLKDFMEMHGSG